MRRVLSYAGVDYHILRRKLKNGVTYYIGVLDDELDGTGRRKYTLTKSLQTASIQEAKRLAKTLIETDELFKGAADLQELVDFWNENSLYIRSGMDEERAFSPVYLANSRGLIERYFLPWAKEQGITKIRQLNRKRMLEWRGWLSANREAFGIGASTVNKVRQALHVEFQFLEDNEQIEKNPLRGVKRIVENPREREIFEARELKALFARSWPDVRQYGLCLFSATTGCRLGEARGLLRKNIHLDRGYVDIVLNYLDNEGLKRPKWNSTRGFVPVPQLTIDTLRRLEEVNPYPVGPDRFVFWGLDAQHPIPKGEVNRALRTAMQVARIPVRSRSFHSFRHTYVSLLSDDVGTERVQKVVGHTNARTTENYNHQTDKDMVVMRQAVEKLWG